MNPRFAAASFLVLLAMALAFVWTTSQALPVLVASHFGALGAADGFVPRSDYVLFTLGLLAAMSLVLAFLPVALTRMDIRHINIPNGPYWLAPERRDRTFAFLRLHFIGFASALVVFLTYVHWLVVQANQHQPPLLSTPSISAGLAVFLTLTAVWLVVLYARFRRLDAVS